MPFHLSIASALCPPIRIYRIPLFLPSSPWLSLSFLLRCRFFVVSHLFRLCFASKQDQESTQYCQEARSYSKCRHLHVLRLRFTTATRVFQPTPPRPHSRKNRREREKRNHFHDPVVRNRQEGRREKQPKRKAFPVDSRTQTVPLESFFSPPFERAWISPPVDIGNRSGFVGTVVASISVPRVEDRVGDETSFPHQKSSRRHKAHPNVKNTRLLRNTGANDWLQHRFFGS